MLRYIIVSILRDDSANKKDTAGVLFVYLFSFLVLAFLTSSIISRIAA